MGLALGALERRRALIADSVLELELSLPDHPITAACDAVGGSLSLEGVVSESGDEFVFFHAVDDGDPAELAAAAEEQLPWCRRARIVDGRENPLVELVLSAPPLPTGLSVHGGTITDADADGDRLAVTAEFPLGVDVRTVLETLDHGVELRAQRTAEREATSERRVRNRVTDSLTDRQLAALRTAYLAGYHDRPRTSSGERVAEALGVSPSTFHQHHRVGVRKLLGAVFDRRDESEPD